MSVSVPTIRSIDINLLQHRTDEAKTGSALPFLLLAIAVVGTLALGWMWVDARNGAAAAAKELDQVNAQIKEMQARMANVSTAGGVADFLALPDTIKAHRPDVTVLLDKLAKLMPEDANVDSLSIAGGGMLKLTGSFASSESVISFMQSAKSSPDFTFVGMSGMTKISQPGADKAPPVPGGAPLPVIQVTFDLKYNADSNKKG